MKARIIRHLEQEQEEEEGEEEEEGSRSGWLL